MPPAVIAIALALASALATAWGMVLRHAAAARPRSSPNRTRAAVASMLEWHWLAGTISSLAGFALQAAAFTFGSLLLVQPLTVLSLMFTLPLAARFSHRGASRAEWFWASVLTASVAGLVAYGRPVPGVEHPLWWHWLLGVLAGGTVILLLVLLARRNREDNAQNSNNAAHTALLLGVAGGIAFAYVAVFAKGAMDRFVAAGWHAPLIHGEFYGMIAAAVLALTLQQASFASGRINQAAPASTATTPVVSIALGLTLLGERFSVAGWELLGILALVAVMASATVFLARAAEV